MCTHILFANPKRKDDRFIMQNTVEMQTMKQRIQPQKFRTRKSSKRTKETEKETVPQIPIQNCSLFGLTDEEAAENRKRYGSNALSRAKRTPFFYKFLEGFRDPIIKILLCALGINCLFLFRTFDLWETLGIAAAILCATLISALSERGGEVAFEKLQAEAAKTTCLCRRGGKNGQDVTMSADLLCAGDVVSLSAGERIPADGILIRGTLRVSMAALNGEGRETERTAQRLSSFGREFQGNTWSPDDNRLLFRGAVVTWGEGQMLCLRVGDNTLFGTLTGELQTETRESPLRTRLSKLARQMSAVGYCAAAAVALSYLVNTFFIDAGCSLAGTKLLLSDPAFVLSSLTHALMLATTMIVVAVPEGLPMMISVVLSANIKRMQRDNVLVRKPVGIETAGSLNVLFCDKTGTLTCGKPVVTEVITGDGTRYAGFSTLKTRVPGIAHHYAVSAVCNTQSHVVQGETHAITAHGGNATDRAILESILQVPGYMEGIPGRDDVSMRVPFDSEKKYSLARVGGVTYIKGAPEVVLRGCTAAYAGSDTTGSRIPFDRKKIDLEMQKTMQHAGRVIALCTEERDGERVFVCLICIRDDLRRGAKQAVSGLQRAGIRVVMITGDNRETAAAIAREAGILTAKDNAEEAILTSGELAALDDAALAKQLVHLRVIARALPQDKSRLVRIAQEQNMTVGMTGDGVNDAPALKIADVGFALGGGTEVAQEAGDIVILDDNIVSIAKAVLYGRTIFKSIRKFIMFQMTTNLTAVGISVLCPIFGIDTPVTVLQMLWINLIMDTLGSLAFAGEAPAPDAMKEKPKRRDAPIMNRYMAWRIALVGGYLLTLCLWFVHSEAMREHFTFYETPVHFLGAFFALFIFADIANSISARTTHVNPFYRLSRNRAFVVIFSGIIAVQLLIIYFGRSIFRTWPLSPADLCLILLLASTVLLYSMLVKAILGARFRGNTV